MVNDAWPVIRCSHSKRKPHAMIRLARIEISSGRSIETSALRPSGRRYWVNGISDITLSSCTRAIFLNPAQSCPARRTPLGVCPRSDRFRGRRKAYLPRDLVDVLLVGENDGVG